ncbi:hypothetical protein P3L10_018331 [Capsicum annuum]
MASWSRGLVNLRKRVVNQISYAGARTTTNSPSLCVRNMKMGEKSPLFLRSTKRRIGRKRRTIQTMEAMKKQIVKLTQQCATNDAKFAKFEELVKKHMPQVFHDEENSESDDN